LREGKEVVGVENTRTPGMYIDIGARVSGATTFFTVWAPLAGRVELELLQPAERRLPMHEDAWGYWHAEAEAGARARYLYVLDGGRSYPDPASHFQPDGVHGPSAVVDHDSFSWTDQNWEGVVLDDYVIYELHVGTFTPEGSFDGIVSRLPELLELGVTAVELMPVAQFPGSRNWGYDGVFPFSVQNSYGGPGGLKRLVDACHAAGLSLVLDVVYNHLGPEGNCLARFGPYFTDAYSTFWGEALNFDREFSAEVRNYFVQNMMHWFERYHVDALRLDAVHAIFDQSAKHLLRELAEAARDCSARRGRHHLLIAESGLNDPVVVRPRDLHGYGIHAQWSDDFHHALHTLLTGEHDGYYEDFGSPAQLCTAMEKGFSYTWQYSAYRKRFYGAEPEGVEGKRFVVCSQNHDQVGNRFDGRRLTGLVSFEALKLAAATVLLSPFIPLLFMGEEYGENAPFLYFISHGDPDLVQAVREGRKREFEAFEGEAVFPDPQAEESFLRSKLRWEKRNRGTHGVLRALYRELLRLRSVVPALSALDRDAVRACHRGRVIAVRRKHGEGDSLMIMNFYQAPAEWLCDENGGPWTRVLCSASEKWNGPGDESPSRLEEGWSVRLSPESFLLYRSAPS
jgi:maltooligosyltrehalose trehalohydrolase